MLVTEPFFGTMKRCDVSPNARAGGFHESQFVPQRFDLLAPFMEIGGPMTFPCTSHHCASSLVRQSDTCRQRTKLTMFGLPLPGVLSNPANSLTDTLPHSLATGCLHHRLLVSRQATMHPGTAASVQGPRILHPECVQGFDHDVGVSQC